MEYFDCFRYSIINNCVYTKNDDPEHDLEYNWRETWVLDIGDDNIRVFPKYWDPSVMNRLDLPMLPKNYFYTGITDEIFVYSNTTKIDRRNQMNSIENIQT